MNFSAFHISSSLRGAGFPKKTGILRTPKVPASAVVAAVHGMAKISVAIGAGHPQLGCKLLTQLFGNRDWQSTNGDELFRQFDPNSQIQQQPETSPWEVLTEEYVPQIGENLRWAELGQEKYQLGWAAACARGLIWGIAYPELAHVAFNIDRDRDRESLQLLIEAGLDISSNDDLDTNDDLFIHAGKIIGAYESNCGELPSAAKELLESRIVAKRM